MIYSKTVTLRDGRLCVLRNGTEPDAQGVLSNFILTHGQTEFLTTYPDETTLTVLQEKEYLKKKTENPREIELVAEVDGVITGTAGIGGVGSAEKTSHRASFGIGIDRRRASSAPLPPDIPSLSLRSWRTMSAPSPCTRAWALLSTAGIPTVLSPGSSAARRSSSCVLS